MLAKRQLVHAAAVTNNGCGKRGARVHQDAQRPHVRLAVVAKVLRQNFGRNPKPGVGLSEGGEVAACNRGLGCYARAASEVLVVAWAQQPVQHGACEELGGKREGDNGAGCRLRTGEAEISELHAAVA